MFRSATTRLTLGYLGLIFGISLIFSIVIYRTSSRDIQDSLQHQRRAILGLPYYGGLRNPSYLDTLVQQEINHEEHNIVFNLGLINLIVLALGGGAAYWLARRTLEPIEEALEAQTRFAADASHELRTPLTAMKSEIEVALRNKTMTAPEARAVLESGLEEVDKLESLASGLLKLAQRRGEPDFTAVDLREVVDEAAERLAKAASQRGLQINIAVAKGITLEADRANMVELVAILLDNAIKYSPDKAKIEIVARPESGQRIRLEVRDHGVGIKATDIPHIFDRFYRADTSRSKQNTPAGYGLGLAIARKIVEQHHGTIAAESQPDYGTVMRVYFPISRPRGPVSWWPQWF